MEKRDAEVQSKHDGETNAVINYSYQRRIKYAAPALYESEAERIKKQCQITMKIDLDEIRNEALRLRKVRQSVQEPPKPFDVAEYYKKDREYVLKDRSELR